MRNPIQEKPRSRATRRHFLNYLHSNNPKSRARSEEYLRLYGTGQHKLEMAEKLRVDYEKRIETEVEKGTGSRSYVRKLLRRRMWENLTTPGNQKRPNPMARR